MSNKSIVNVLPTKKFFIDSITRDISIDKCIEDLIDNSIDGAKKCKQKDNYEDYFIRIHFSKKTFTIEDNCGGISLEEAKQYAFRFGNNDDNLKSYSSSGFGIGMKRAFFKIGKNINVESATEDSKFIVKLDVDKWLKEEAWTIVVESKNNVGFKIGTKIQVTKINKTISNIFNKKDFELKLRKLVEKNYRNYINKGLKIVINQIELNKKIINQEEVYTKNYIFKDMNVDIRVMRGEVSLEDSGWYIQLNEKIVVSADKGELTGWGLENNYGVKVEEYSPDFYKFRGYVYAKSENPLVLPYTTTKDGIDKDTEEYMFILYKIMEASQKCRESFKENDVVNIQYKKPRDEVEMLEERFKVTTAKAVGIRTYDEYLKGMKK